MYFLIAKIIFKFQIINPNNKKLKILNKNINIGDII